jgi:hypothetical protein
MKAGMQNAKRSIVIASEDNEFLVGLNAGWKPYEEPVLGDFWNCNN